MELVYKILLIAISLFGWIIILFGLPGTLVILLGALLYAWPMDFEAASDSRVLLTLFLLAAVGETAENFIVYFAAKRAHVPTSNIILAIFGGILGALIGVPVPIIGSVIGLFLGMFLTSFIVGFFQTWNWQRALNIAENVLISRALATGAKMIIGAMMLFYIFTEI